MKIRTAKEPFCSPKYNPFNDGGYMARIRFSNAILCCMASLIFVMTGCSGASNSNEDKTSIQASKDSLRQFRNIRATAFPAATGDRTTIRNVSIEDLSVIYIVSQPEVELLMTGPGGRRTGKPPESSKPLEEIPNSSYYDQYIEDPEGEGGMETRHLEIRRPADGDYLLSVFGTRIGTYGLGIRLYDVNGRQYSWDRNGIPVNKDTMHTYRISFRKDGTRELVNADTLK
jgi:hypothetical protein